jgi:2',3'-cyclic-nucleotide 2'-phosphodiesterase (5'-nucleotidase family)
MKSIHETEHRFRMVPGRTGRPGPWRLALMALLVVAALPATQAQAEMARLHLVWTNDIHGHVAPEGARFMNPNFPPPLGGAASAAAYIENLRKFAAKQPNEAVILVDAGDTWQGAPIGTLTDGKVMEKYFDILDYDVVIPGNHEFDKGKDIAIRMSHNMKHKFVCANIYKEGTNQLVDWVEPYRIIERAGLRIGIIGATTPGTKDMAFEENIAGLAFGPVLPAVERWRDHLYNKENVDTVFLVVHEGLPFSAEEQWKNLQERIASGEDIREHVYGAMDLAHVLERVPVIVAGHTHRGYREPWIDPLTHAMVLETFGNGSSLGHVILEFDQDTKTMVGWESPRRDGVLITLFEDEWWPELEMQERLQPFVEEVRAGLEVTVGESRTELTRRGGNNSPMGNFVTDAMRDAFDADMAFTNNGGLRTDLPAGKITVGNLMTLLPFGNSLVVVEMDGRTVRNIFDRKAGRNSSGLSESGAQVVVDPDAPRGQRVLELTLGGQPVQPDRIYKVVTSDYLMEGNSGLDFLAQLPPDKSTYTMLLTRAAVTRYLEKNSPIAPHRDDRWVERPGGQMAPYLQGWDLP